MSNRPTLIQVMMLFQLRKFVLEEELVNFQSLLSKQVLNFWQRQKILFRWMNSFNISHVGDGILLNFESFKR